LTNGSPGIDRRYLTFMLGSENYAVPLGKIQEVIAYSEPTRMPNTPLHFKGVINLRGQVIPIIDLRLKLKFNEAPRSQETAIIILDLNPLCVGIVVDQIDAVMAISAEDLSDPPEIGSTNKTDYIASIARVSKKLVMILDIEKALEVEDLIAMKNFQNQKLVA
jgi:purine-binding chemotaxis protein CheW